MNDKKDLRRNVFISINFVKTILVDLLLNHRIKITTWNLFEWNFKDIPFKYSKQDGGNNLNNLIRYLGVFWIPHYPKIRNNHF